MRFLLVVLASLFAAPSLPAQKLRVGDPAPPLVIAEWIHGAPVPAMERGKPYVIALWSSGCESCRANVLTFNHVQERFADRGLRVIAVAARRELTATLASTKEFAKRQGESLRFTLAWDVDSRTTDAYLPAKNISAHPVVIVDPQGKVAFMGLPAECEVVFVALERAAWDPAKAAPWVKEYARIDSMYSAPPAPGEAAAKAAAEAEALFMEVPEFGNILGPVRVFLLLRAGRFEDAHARAITLIDRWITEGDADRLNAVAWDLVDLTRDLPRRDLDLPLRAAARAVELTKERDWAMLDTLANVHFARGDVQKALEVQRKAVALTDDPAARKALETFEAAAKAAGSPAKK